MRAIHAVLALAVITLAACDKKPESAQTATADVAAGMGGMGNMQGMQMIPQMREHLDSIATMQPAQMAAMMPAHSALATHMLDAMGADMQGRHMQADVAWMSLGDSLRGDLSAMPALTGQTLGTRMQAHVARMQRMMVLHQGMMQP